MRLMESRLRPLSAALCGYFGGGRYILGLEALIRSAVCSCNCQHTSPQRLTRTTPWDHHVHGRKEPGSLGVSFLHSGQDKHSALELTTIFMIGRMIPLNSLKYLKTTKHSATPSLLQPVTQSDIRKHRPKHSLYFVRAIHLSVLCTFHSFHLLFEINPPLLHHHFHNGN